ncbi:MAG: hypothetical protein E6Q67_12780 [Roseateles sp.]|nr:MAG: hypothetical protein E6Q67_12780 [Roseateles sp.]
MSARHVFIALFLALGCGAWVGHLQGQKELDQLRVAQAETGRLAARAATRQLEAAQQRGDQLTRQLATAERQIQTLTTEKRDALKKATTGRACLGTAALRVLDGAAGIRVAGLPAAAGGTAAADGRVATDSDIGQWALDAGAQYEQCRERLGALIAWHRGPQ